MRIAVIGANGQLGTDICSVLMKNGHEVKPLNHDTIEIAEFYSVLSNLQKINCEIAINTAAMHNLEECEKRPDRAFAVNGLGAINLAKATHELDMTLIHISTDYIFDGSKRIPYVENDTPCPLNVYGNTKLSGEYFIQTMAEKYFILRTSGLFGMSACRAKKGINFVQLMLKFAKEGREIRVVNDEVVTPTYTRDVVAQLLKLLATKNYGIFHATAQGSCSWYEFAKKIFEISERKAKLSIAGPDEFQTKVKRPKYSVLDNQNLRSLKLDVMPNWEQGLKRYLIEIRNEQ